MIEAVGFNPRNLDKNVPRQRHLNRLSTSVVADAAVQIRYAYRGYIQTHTRRPGDENNKASPVAERRLSFSKNLVSVLLRHRI